MAQTSSSAPRPSTAVAAPAALPTVRLEVRAGPTRSYTHEVADSGFLIGTVPGCDLRLPGAELPPVICLITRQPNGANLRKLVPTHPIQVNGKAVSTTALVHGDRVTLGSVELLVQIQSPLPHSADAAPVTAPTQAVQPPPVREERSAVARANLDKREHQLQEQLQELARVRVELSDIRQQLYERYRQRRDRLSGMHEAIDRAAKKIQERKHQLDLESTQAVARRTQLEDEAAKLAKARQEFEAQQQAFTARETETARRQNDLADREQQLIRDRETFESNQAQYQADLVRLDRAQAALEQRQQQLQERERDIDERFQHLQQTSLELEEHARQLDETQETLRREREELAQQEKEHAITVAQLGQRTAALEGQQAMLATLRTRLERMREEVRREQQLAAEHQARLDAAEAEVGRRQQELDQLRIQVDADRQFQQRERSQFEERQKVLADAVAQLRQVDESLAVREQEWKRRSTEVEAALARQTEEAARLRTQSDQVLEMQKRLAADREALREREAALVQNEQVREALQEQLRRRSEELAARQRTLAEQARNQAEDITALETRKAELERERRLLEEKQQAHQRELEARLTELEHRRQELQQREEQLQRQTERLQAFGREVASDRKALAEERALWDRDQAAAAEAAAGQRADWEAAQREALALREQLPELELRAQAVGERLGQAREQLREHLGELHTYARQSQEDLDALRAQIQLEAEQVRQQQQALHRAREEHRLAVAAFRQQLIEWQGQIVDMKRSLAHGETRLERRQAQVSEQVRQLDASSERLAQQAEQLQEQERIVAEQRQEMERHLDDMREWYRHKLRELSERRRQEDGESVRAVSDSAPPGAQPAAAGEDSAALNPTDTPAAILALTSEIDPGDRKLGELLRQLNLVDEETLTSLLIEARRQRRSLRQALLAGGYLTLYQMALIETGNVDGLVVGPLRVIDRLRVTPHEAVYRVFDPRRGQEAVLRHLAEAELTDPAHVEEFRQRFAATVAIRHPHVAATLEVLEIGGRPAVLQEWLLGLPSTDWPSLAAVPGVWFRLVCQAALGLHTAHQASVMHGHLHPDCFLLTGEGIVKLCGLGEPAWLVTPPLLEPGERSLATDVADFGRIAATWAALAARRKAARPLPEALQVIVNRLAASDSAVRYTSAEQLLEELDQAGAALPPNAEAWDRLLRHVRDHAAEEARVRQSA
jgi:chromosome segregation ATPase